MAVAASLPILRLDFGYVNSQEQLPGALTLQKFMQNPRQAQPEFLLQRAERNYDYVRGGFTLWTPLGTTQAIEGKVQANYQDLDHPLPFAIIDQNTTNRSVELRYLLTAPLFELGSRFTAGFQYLSEYQVDQQLSWFSVKMTAVSVVLRRTRGWSSSPIATRMVPGGPGASRVRLAALAG